jgi:hypothetical protein
VVNLADEVVLGDGRAGGEFGTVDNAYVQVALTDIDGADLLIGYAALDGKRGSAVEIGLQFRGRDVGGGASVAGGVRLLGEDSESKEYK